MTCKDIDPILRVLEAALRETALTRSRLVERIMGEFGVASISSPESSSFYARLGSIAGAFAFNGFDRITAFIADPLTMLLDDVRAAVVGECPVTAPTEIATSKALSKMNNEERREAFQLAIDIADGDVSGFLQSVLDAEILSESLYPVHWQGWTISHGTFSAIGNQGRYLEDVGDAEGHEIRASVVLLYPILIAWSQANYGHPHIRPRTSDHAVLGVYSHENGRPFDGMEAKYLATLFRIFFGLLFCGAPSTRKAPTVLKAVQDAFGLYLQVLVEGYVVFRASVSPAGLDGQPVHKRQKASQTPTRAQSRAEAPV
ncbi:hypothetical protein B0H17DRAFT_1133346 [Mycena rosella]|uniref:Uncharacterized protein n=1 Tax=Mycena rosella TaxID=1033263 RepID=A0AAD7DHU1_MYCRO|nr:hypothetical protein B0H17DRAFT_1133346 [Mycena rosella]